MTQDLQTKAIRKHLNMLINEYGGLPENAVSDFKKWFMAECKKRKKKHKKIKIQKKQKDDKFF